MPNSRSRLLTEYAAIPKMPVIDSIAPMNPSTPNDAVAIREGNSTTSSIEFHGWASTGSPASTSRAFCLMAAASSRGSRRERTTRYALFNGA